MEDTDQPTPLQDDGEGDAWMVGCQVPGEQIDLEAQVLKPSRPGYTKRVFGFLYFRTKFVRKMADYVWEAIDDTYKAYIEQQDEDMYSSAEQDWLSQGSTVVPDDQEPQGSHDEQETDGQVAPDGYNEPEDQGDEGQGDWNKPGQVEQGW